jgi:hypothetical protein
LFGKSQRRLRITLHFESDYGLAAHQIAVFDAVLRILEKPLCTAQPASAYRSSRSMKENICKLDRHQRRLPRLTLSQVSGVGSFQKVAAILYFPSPPRGISNPLEIVRRKLCLSVGFAQILKGS